MTIGPRRAGLVLLASLLGVANTAGGARPEEGTAFLSTATRDSSPPDETPAEPRPSPTPFPGRPIAESVDRAVDRFVRERLSACRDADEGGVPCFPILVEARGLRYSVADSLRNLEPDDRPRPSSTPGFGEEVPGRPGPLSASGTVVAFDPVCKVRQLLKSIGGRSRTYHLYRVWDESGERAILRDRPLEPGEFGGVPTFHYVPLGTFTDECEAVAAWRRALRETEGRLETGRAEPAPADPTP